MNVLKNLSINQNQNKKKVLLDSKSLKTKAILNLNNCTQKI